MSRFNTRNTNLFIGKQDKGRGMKEESLLLKHFL